MLRGEFCPPLEKISRHAPAKQHQLEFELALLRITESSVNQINHKSSKTSIIIINKSLFTIKITSF